MKTFGFKIFILCIGLSACNNTISFKEMGPVYGPLYKAAPYNYALFTADKNFVPLVGNTRYIDQEEYCSGCYSLSFFTFEDSMNLRDFFGIANLNLSKVGSYEIFPDDPTNNTLGQGLGLDKNTEIFYITNLEAGDIEGDTYELLESTENEVFNNWMEIASVDTTAKIIKGKFQFHFVKILDNDSRNPKYVKFSNGEFVVNIN